jgi:hypothetical protein
MGSKRKTVNLVHRKQKKDSKLGAWLFVRIQNKKRNMFSSPQPEQ